MTAIETCFSSRPRRPSGGRCCSSSGRARSSAALGRRPLRAPPQRRRRPLRRRRHRPVADADDAGRDGAAGVALDDRTRSTRRRSPAPARRRAPAPRRCRDRSRAGSSRPAGRDRRAQPSDRGWPPARRSRRARPQVDAGCASLLLVWLSGVAILTLRLLAGWLWVQRLRSRGTAPARRELAADRRAGSRSRLHIARPIRLLRVGAGRSADGDRLAAAGRAAAGERAGGPGAAAARGDPRARARAHPAPRLPRQPAADARRDAAVLSPRGLVAVAPHPDRARELLRRSRGQPVRRSVCLRAGACRPRGAARGFEPSRARGDRRLAAASRPPAARRAVARRPRPRLARGQHRGRAHRGHRRRSGRKERARRRTGRGRSRSGPGHAAAEAPTPVVAASAASANAPRRFGPPPRQRRWAKPGRLDRNRAARRSVDCRTRRSRIVARRSHRLVRHGRARPVRLGATASSAHAADAADAADASDAADATGTADAADTADASDATDATGAADAADTADASDTADAADAADADLPASGRAAATSRGPTASRSSRSSTTAPSSSPTTTRDVKSLSPGGIPADQRGRLAEQPDGGVRGRRLGQRSSAATGSACPERPSSRRDGVAGAGVAALHPADRHRRPGARRAHPQGEGPVGCAGRDHADRRQLGKRVYFTELLKTPGLDAATMRQALDQAGRQIDSDFELATLLISSDRLLVDEATRRAYFDAARSIESDFEMRRVYSSALKRGPCRRKCSRACSTPAPGSIRTTRRLSCSCRSRSSSRSMPARARRS